MPYIYKKDDKKQSKESVIKFFLYGSILLYAAFLYGIFQNVPYTSTDTWVEHEIPRGKVIHINPIDGELDAETQNGFRVVIVIGGTMYQQVKDGSRQAVSWLGDSALLRVKSHKPGVPVKYNVTYTKYN